MATATKAKRKARSAGKKSKPAKEKVEWVDVGIRRYAPIRMFRNANEFLDQHKNPPKTAALVKRTGDRTSFASTTILPLAVYAMKKWNCAPNMDADSLEVDDDDGTVTIVHDDRSRTVLGKLEGGVKAVQLSGVAEPKSWNDMFWVGPTDIMNTLEDMSLLIYDAGTMMASILEI